MRMDVRVFNFNGVCPSAYIVAETPLKIRSYYLLVSWSTHFLTTDLGHCKILACFNNCQQKPRAIRHRCVYMCLCGLKPIDVSFN